MTDKGQPVFTHSVFKQYMAHESTGDELKYVEEVWSEKWQEKGFESDLDYLRGTDYFRILNKYLKRSSRVLEGGCGQGQWVRIFKDLGHTITGVELSQSTVDGFKTRYPKYDVQRGDVFHLEFANDTFDAYLSFGVIEHFEAGPGPVIAEAHRVLKPDGLFCVSVPYLNKSKRKRLGAKADNTKDFPGNQALRFYQYVMSKRELRSQVEAKGFEVLKIYPTDAGHTLKTKSSLVKNIAAGTQSRSGLMRAVRPILRKAWHLYVGLQSKEQHAHMIFAICRAKK